MPIDLIYVDDEPDIRTIVAFALEDEPDLVVRLAASGAEALRMVGERRPDLVLLDVMMPQMDGPATLAALRRVAGDGLPVAFVTAKAQPREVAALAALGARAVLTKPFDPLALADQVRALVGSQTLTPRAGTT